MRILPISCIRVETAEFDTQRLKAYLEGKPLPEGEDYQHGEMYDEYNVRQYVLHRDGYTCQCCGAHPTDKKAVKLRVHHLESRKTGGNAPNNLITLCASCHAKLHTGEIVLPKGKRKRGHVLRDAAFMGIMRKTLFQRLRSMCDVPITEVRADMGHPEPFNMKFIGVGNEQWGRLYTDRLPLFIKAIREKYEIKKTHTSDARIIAKGEETHRVCPTLLLKPVRRHNRQIHKATILKGGVRKKNQAPKYVFGFQLFDGVALPSGETGFVFGRRSSGSFDVRHLDGRKISAGVSHKKLQPIEKAKSLLAER